MKNTLLLALLCLASTIVLAQKKIVVMGSSTAAGSGATATDSSWVGRLQNHFRKNTSDGLDTIIYNIAGYGQTTYHQMPTGFTTTIPNRDAVNTNHNVTKALSFVPDVIIINLPSNDVANYYWGPGTYTTNETMNNYRAMRSYILNNSGANIFVTTTQPRNDMSNLPEKATMLRQLVDSINTTFGNRAIDFWSPLVTNDGQNLLRDDRRADNVHPNNTGHRLLFEQVIQKNLFVVNAPLPVTIQSFKAEKRGGQVQLQWKAGGETAGTYYGVERSSNGIDFTPLATVQAQVTGSAASYQWTDAQPLNGRSFYRLSIHEGGTVKYSSVVNIDGGGGNGLVQQFAVNGNALRFNSSGNGPLTTRIFNMNGALLLQKVHTVSGTTTITLDISSLPRGSYVLSIEHNGTQEQQRFLR